MTRCRMCGYHDLQPVLDLGHQPPSNSLLTPSQLEEPETHYPLLMLLCIQCGLAQLAYVVPKEILFGTSYPYDTSASRTLSEHLAAMAQALITRFGLGANDLAVDIGSNVGVLPEAFTSGGTRGLGVEPAGNMAAKAKAQGIETLNAFFTPKLARDVVSTHGRASVITATNVFAHIDDLDSIAEGVRELLSPSGCFVIEAQYFLDLIEHFEYDQIYHEHYSYMSVKPMTLFFKRHGLEVFDVEHVSTHGGSLRVFVGFPDAHAVGAAVGMYLRKEEVAGLQEPGQLSGFAQKVADSRDNMMERLVALKAQGKRVAGIGAPAKASTLLNYCKISTNLIEFVTDAAPSKIGLYIPGMHVPVLAESALLERQPDYGILMAWNIKEELMSKFAPFEKRGGVFLVPIPELVEARVRDAQT